MQRLGDLCKTHFINTLPEANLGGSLRGQLTHSKCLLM